MAARDYSYLSRFDLEYKKAFARQQGVPEQLIDTLTADGSAGGLDDYLNENFDICHSYEGKGKSFLHRENTYPKKCHECDINTDFDYNIYYLKHDSVPPVTPRHVGEGDEPMRPENYTRYDEILRGEKAAEEEREERIQREREEVRQEALRRKEEERQVKRAEREKFEHVGKIGAQTLREGECPVFFEGMNTLEISKVCGHGLSREAREKLPNSKCPICQRPGTFTRSNTVELPTQQGKIRRVAGKLSRLSKRPGVLGKLVDRFGLGGKKTRRRKHKKSAKKNKIKRASRNTKTKVKKVKKGRKNKTKRK
jgi:hypothetical protein